MKDGTSAKGIVRDADELAERLSWRDGGGVSLRRPPLKRQTDRLAPVRRWYGLPLELVERTGVPASRASDDWDGAAESAGEATQQPDQQAEDIVHDADEI